jgi:hypothetical protein
MCAGYAVVRPPLRLKKIDGEWMRVKRTITGANGETTVTYEPYHNELIEAAERRWMEKLAHMANQRTMAEILRDYGVDV